MCFNYQISPAPSQPYAYLTTSCVIVAELFARAFTDDLVGIEMVGDSIAVVALGLSARGRSFIDLCCC